MGSASSVVPSQRLRRIASGLAIWRTVYGVLLGWVSASIILHPDDCAGSEPGWYFAVLAIAPSLVAIILAFIRPMRAIQVALGHDILIAALALIGLVSLPNYMGLVLMSPLGAYIIEGIVLFILLKRVGVVHERANSQEAR